MDRAFLEIVTLFVRWLDAPRLPRIIKRVCCDFGPASPDRMTSSGVLCTGEVLRRQFRFAAGASKHGRQRATPRTHLIPRAWLLIPLL
jgi:hypothetical protein